MNVPTLRRNRFLVLLTLVTMAGFAWRVTYVLWQRDVGVFSDGIHYHTGANYLADGRGFINPIALAITGQVVPDAVHPPLWEVVLSGASILGLRSYLWHQLVACVVGAATIFMVGVAGREAFGKRVGLIGAALTAVYANVWLFEREVLSEPVAMLTITTLIWLVYRFRHRPGLGRVVAVGAALGAVVLTRSEMIVLSVLLVAPLILRRTEVDARRRLAWLAAAGVTCAALLAPWFIYNTTRFERPVPLSTGLGGTLWSGNCSPTYGGELYAYAAPCIFVVNGISSDPSIADGQYRDLAFDFMGQHKSEIPGVALARIGRTFGVFRPGQQLDFETQRGTALWVFQLGTAMYWMLLPLGVYGVIVARRRRVIVYPLLVFPVAVVLSVAFTIGAVRYRAPAEIPLVLLAAVGIDQLARAWRRRRASTRDTASPTMLVGASASGTAP